MLYENSFVDTRPMRLTGQMDTKTEADEPPLLDPVVQMHKPTAGLIRLFDPKDIDRGITIVILGI